VTFARDQRGQAIGIARFILSLAVGAILVGAVLWPLANPLLERARGATSNPTGNQATEWLQSLVDFMPMIFLVIAFFGLLVLAVYQREVAG